MSLPATHYELAFQSNSVGWRWPQSLRCHRAAPFRLRRHKPAPGQDFISNALALVHHVTLVQLSLGEGRVVSVVTVNSFGFNPFWASPVPVERFSFERRSGTPYGSSCKWSSTSHDSCGEHVGPETGYELGIEKLVRKDFSTSNVTKGSLCVVCAPACGCRFGFGLPGAPGSVWSLWLSVASGGLCSLFSSKGTITPDWHRPEKPELCQVPPP